MADDTRLAEACLLLNYSCQSHEDQMPTKVATKVEPAAQASDLDETGKPSNMKGIAIESKIITPPPEHSYAIPANHEYPPDREDEINSVSDQMALSLDKLTEYLMCEESAIEVDKPGCYSNPMEFNQDPICNLLAVVNCALPCKKSRPTILQRCPVVSPKAPIDSKATLSCLIDHNYCRSNATDETLRHDRILGCSIPNLSVSPDRSMDLNLPNAARQSTDTASSCSVMSQGFTMETGKEATVRPLRMVAIHLGAGNSQNDKEAQELAKSICEDIMRQTNSNYFCPIYSGKRRNLNQLKECDDYQISLDNQIMNAELAVVKLVQQMEDHLTLNCGRGSNLNMKGHVECDASLMCDKNGLWSGVGAISGCRNPIVLAKCLYDHRTIPRPMGLKQPNLLVGSGAKEWMREHCPYLAVPDSKMISSKAFSTYQKLKSRYDSVIQLSNHLRTTPNSFTPCTQMSGSKRSLQMSIKEDRTICQTTGNHWQENCPSTLEHDKVATRAIKQEPLDTGYGRLDTVGAVAVDWENNFASAISSGGLLLKYKGRIGQAAIPGAGCWSQDSVAITTTGVGEYLTDNLFAKKFYDKMTMLRMLYDLGHIKKDLDFGSLVSQNVHECFEELTCKTSSDNVNPEDRLAGMLSVCSLNSKNSPVRRINNDDLYLSFAHNTNTMCIGYMSYGESQAHSVMSRRDGSEKDGKPVVGTIKLDSFIDSNLVTTPDERASSESEHPNAMSD